MMIDAIIAGTLVAEKHLPLIQAAQSFGQEFARLKAEFVNEEAVPWLSSDASSGQLQNELALLVQAAGAF
jgi:hypothetical protein